ncbi:MAG: TIGR03619 family F420-dependent LLM class oxidoreductase [Acidimicrobiales bacterium]|nr:TIGR03619 family F420-dependent LLM class oxidoreductase [Acidimicrobiales bacterium]
MKFGFFGVNSGILANPDTMVSVAVAAETNGWESIWTGEHVVVADPQRPPSPVVPGTHFVDQITSIAFLAAHTSTIRLGTGIVILPQRNPVVLAKELASLDVLSGGRLEAGFGVGYVPVEFEAIGVPFSERGVRSDNHLDAMTALWRGETSFEGPFTSWSGVEASPRPIQAGGPPIHLGGGAPATFLRVVQRAHGWYGFLTTLESTASSVESIRTLENELGRPAGMGPVCISVSPAEPVDQDLVNCYRDLGVDRMILVRDFRDVARGPEPTRAEAVMRFLAETPERLNFN